MWALTNNKSNPTEMTKNFIHSQTWLKIYLQREQIYFDVNVIVLLNISPK